MKPSDYRMLVNRNSGFLRPDDLQLVEFSSYHYQIELEEETAAQLALLLDAIDGWAHMTAVSGYRSTREQEAIYTDTLRTHGMEFTQQYVALPGHSEHHTGLAVDMALIVDDIDELTPEFPYHGPCQHFRDVAAEYGFIQRYPQGKEHITGIAHEPWHFRYVQRDTARCIAQAGSTLEEFWGRPI